MEPTQLKALIRDIPDFPKPGIVFKDITPLLGDAKGLRAATEGLAERIATHRPDALVGIESRGFIFGAAVALQLGLPLKLVRKPGKLPHQTVSVEYDLEYGSDRIEIHVDSVGTGRRYAIVDDLIATGGTVAATVDLLQKQGGVVACIAAVIELEFLKGRDRFGSTPVEALLTY